MSSFFTTFSWRSLLTYGLVLSLMGTYAWKITLAQKRNEALFIDSITVMENLKLRLEKSGDQLISEIKRKENLEND